MSTFFRTFKIFNDTKNIKIDIELTSKFEGKVRHLDDAEIEKMAKANGHVETDPEDIIAASITKEMKDTLDAMDYFPRIMEEAQNNGAK